MAKLSRIRSVGSLKVGEPVFQGPYLPDRAEERHGSRGFYFCLVEMKWKAAIWLSTVGWVVPDMWCFYAAKGTLPLRDSMEKSPLNRER
jgi:hypothetical protein